MSAQATKLNSLQSLREWVDLRDNPGIRPEDKPQVMYCIKYWVRELKKPPRFVEATLHATDIGHARLQFWQSEIQREFRKVEVVAIAPVVGYLVDDNHGDELTV